MNKSHTFKTQGQGSPIDGLDSLCHKWHQCRSCTTIDSTNGSCNPNEAFYEVAFNPFTFRLDCQYNPTNCAKNTCKCDEELAFELVASLDEMNDNAITHSDGSGFDHTNNCKATTGTNNNGGNGSNEPSSVQCCGVYPNRVTYNTGKHDCCNNSFLSNIGGC